MSIQLIRAQIAQHGAAEFLTRKGFVPDNDLAMQIELAQEPAYAAILQKRLDWLMGLLRLQTKLTDTIQAHERSDLE